MKLWQSGVMVLGWALLLGCGDKKDSAKPISGPPQAGGLYSFNDGEGGFRAGKVIAVEDEVVFVRLYSERWTERPSLAQARQTTKPMAVAYRFETMSGMRPVLLETGAATPEEWQEYETWKRSNREVF